MSSRGSLDQLRAGEIAVLCVFAAVADLYFAGQTALLVAYGNVLHFTLTESARISTAEGGAFGVGMLLAALSATVARPTRRKLMGLLAILALAQFGSAAASSIGALTLCRTSSGLAAGLILSLGTATIGSRPNPGRAFALYSGMVFVSGVVSIPLITQLLDTLGLSGAFAAYGALVLLSTCLVGKLPASGCAVEAASKRNARPNRSRAAYLLLLGSLLLNFVFNGGICVLSQTLGLRITGLQTVWLSELLAGSMLFGLLGTATAAALADRGWNLQSMIAGNAALIVSVVLLVTWPDVKGFALAMAILNASAALLLPNALSALASIDSQGAQWGNLAAQIGYSLGPVILAEIDTRAGITGLVSASALAFAGSASLAILAFRYFTVNTTVPESAL